MNDTMNCSNIDMKDEINYEVSFMSLKPRKNSNTKINLVNFPSTFDNTANTQNETINDLTPIKANNENKIEKKENENAIDNGILSQSKSKKEIKVNQIKVNKSLYNYSKFTNEENKQVKKSLTYRPNSNMSMNVINEIKQNYQNPKNFHSNKNLIQLNKENDNKQTIEKAINKIWKNVEEKMDLLLNNNQANIISSLQQIFEDKTFTILAINKRYEADIFRLEEMLDISNSSNVNNKIYRSLIEDKTNEINKTEELFKNKQVEVINALQNEYLKQKNELVNFQKEQTEKYVIEYKTQSNGIRKIYKANKLNNSCFNDINIKNNSFAVNKPSPFVIRKVGTKAKN